jgi:peptidoglycan/LPS O-acetylase OafA/YrhL
VFGFLRVPGLVLLGRVSYSTYILHGAVLFVATRAIDRLVPIAGMSPLAYWAFIGAVGIAVVLVSAVSFQYVEYPFLNRGVRPQRVPVSKAPSPQGV